MKLLAATFMIWLLARGELKTYITLATVPASSPQSSGGSPFNLDPGNIVGNVLSDLWGVSLF